MTELVYLAAMTHSDSPALAQLQSWSRYWTDSEYLFSKIIEPGAFDLVCYSVMTVEKYPLYCMLLPLHTRFNRREDWVAGIRYSNDTFFTTLDYGGFVG